jgi:hypothetical protein
MKANLQLVFLFELELISIVRGRVNRTRQYNSIRDSLFQRREPLVLPTLPDNHIQSHGVSNLTNIACLGANAILPSVLP